MHGTQAAPGIFRSALREQPYQGRVFKRLLAAFVANSKLQPEPPPPKKKKKNDAKTSPNLQEAEVAQLKLSKNVSGHTFTQLRLGALIPATAIASGQFLVGQAGELRVWMFGVQVLRHASALHGNMIELVASA